ncbi:hypothetical protein BRAO375_990033 [Bradyrhizobium sp. ORS 375]|nr:hypothetical protein BRAO375_990033 [Bradyrhizobium sp. ORS 375]
MRPRSSVSPPLPHETDTGIDQALPVPEKAVAIPPDEVKLVLGTFLDHRLDSLHGMHASQLRDELGEKVCFRPRAVQKLVAGEQHLFKDDLLGTNHQLKRVLVGKRDTLGELGRFLGYGIRPGELGHGHLSSC